MVTAHSPWGAEIKAALENLGWEVHGRIVRVLIATKGEESILLLHGVTRRELERTTGIRKVPDRRVVIDGKWETRIKDLHAKGFGPRKIYAQLVREGCPAKFRTVEQHLGDLRARRIL
jgi:hypothetical protein